MVKLDGSARFECIIDALPKAKLSWFTNDKELTTKDNVKFETDLKSSTYSLVVPKVLNSHVGTYVVKALNTIGEKAESFNLELLSIFFVSFS